MTNVRKYTTAQLLAHAKTIPGFTHFPKGHWMMIVRSDEDEMTFDDKGYLFKEKKFIMMISLTSNKGNKGTAVLCSDQWTYDCYKATDGKKVRHHKGKMPALRQVKGIPYKRDFTADGRTNPTGPVFTDIIHTNFHANTYDMKTTILKKYIGGWSLGCIVTNDIPKYLQWLEHCRESEFVSLCLVDEFEPK